MKLCICSLPVQFSSSTCLSNYLIDSTSDISLVWDGSPLEEGIFDSCSISFTPVGSSETVCVEVESFHIEDCNVNVNYRDYLLSTEVRFLYINCYICLYVYSDITEGRCVVCNMNAVYKNDHCFWKIKTHEFRGISLPRDDSLHEMIQSSPESSLFLSNSFNTFNTFKDHSISYCVQFWKAAISDYSRVCKGRF